MFKSVTKNFLTAILFLCIALVSPVFQSALAQDDEDVIANDIIKPVVDEYQPVTLQSLSKMYWATGKLDLTDTQALNNYMLINECDLYVQYYHDDLEWKNIQQATREYLSKNMSRFSTKFELIVPITLNRYNVEEQKFTLDEESQIINARRLDVRTVKEQKKSQKKITGCDTNSVIEGYDSSVILVLNQPFTLVEIEVPVELADLYLQEAKRSFDNLPPDLQLARYERIAYLRMKFTITAYKEMARHYNGQLRPVVLGSMDGYEVYADYGKLKPLAEQDLTYKKRRLRRRRAPEPKPVQPVEEKKSTVDFTE